MRNEELGMRNMKREKKTRWFYLCSFFIFSFVLFTACDNPTDTPEIKKPVKNDYGKVSVSLVGEETARTVMPPTVFDKYVYTFTKAGATTGVVKTPDDGFFTLEVGSYTVAVQAYIGTAEPYTLAASGVSSPFTIGSGDNAQVEVKLSGVTAATKGKFSYTITYPAGAEAEITLKKWPELNNITLNPTTQGNGKTQTLELDAGSYLLTVLISKNNLYAGVSEAVRIYPSVSTVYTKDFLDSDMLQIIAPTLTLTAGNTKLTYAWTASNPAADSYDVYWKVGNGLTAADVKTGTKITGASSGGNISGLTNGTAYSVVVTANKAGYNSVDSVVRTGTPSLASFTTAPILTLMATGNGSLRYTWTASNPAADSYDVYWKIGNGLTAVNVKTGTKITGAVSGGSISGLTNGTAYSVVVTANKVDYSSVDSAVQIIIVPTFFSSIADLDIYLKGRPANTAATPYIVALNVNDLGGRYDAPGSLGYVLRDNNTKYVDLNLSGSTFTSIKWVAFYGCTSLTSVTIPNSVTSIETYAFRGCTNLTSVTIPNSVTSIEYGAFNGCTSLTSVTIPNSVIYIMEYAFSDCTSLTSVTIGSNVTSIGGAAFSGCTSLTSVTIPNSVTSIGSAFSGCTSLTSVTIPNSVTSIGSRTFQDCANLTSVTIGNSVTSIGDFTFSGTNLTSVTFQSTIPTSGFDYNAFYGLGDLRDKYLAGGRGTYTTRNPGDNAVWTKQ